MGAAEQRRTLREDPARAPARRHALRPESKMAATAVRRLTGDHRFMAGQWQKPNNFYRDGEIGHSLCPSTQRVARSSNSAENDPRGPPRVMIAGAEQPQA